MVMCEDILVPLPHREINFGDKRMDRVLLTGADELLTRHFMDMYEGVYDMRLLTHRPRGANDFYWDPMCDEIDPQALEGVEHIVHVAGATRIPSSLDVRSKDLLLSQRANGVALIGRMMMAKGIEVESFITASSANFYGSTCDPYIHTEASLPSEDFLASLHASAEEETYLLEIEALVQRSVAIRFGHIFCHYGGILPHIAACADMGVSLIFGLGEQILPWVHVSDAVRAVRYAIENRDICGAYNCTAPKWASYRKIATTAARMQVGRCIPIHLPKLVLKLMYSDFSNQYLYSNRVSSKHLVKSGFDFLYPDIDSALASIYGRR